MERSVSIEDIAQAVSELYPRLETLYIQQDMRLRNLVVENDPRLDQLDLLDRRTLGEQLQDFRGRFAFEPCRS